MIKNFLTVGIDFGTTNSVISYYKKSPIIFKDSIKDFIPTKIYFDEKITCGNYIPIDIDEKSKKLLSNFKVKIGTNFSYQHNDKIITEYEILIIFFNHLKSLLNKSFPDTQFNVVLTVPSNFNDTQRTILIDVAKKVGFNILRIINEPTAAAFAYGIDNDIEDEKILVFDLGGGTMDLSVLEIDDNFFETIDSVGVNDLGGNNFTDVIYEDAIKQFKHQFNVQEVLISKNKLIQLWYKCNKAKEKLSWVDTCQIQVKDFLKINNENKDLIYNLDKSKFKNLAVPLLDRIRRKTDLLKDKHSINKIILVGGSSKLGLVQQLIKDQFNMEPMVHTQLQHVVSLGATYYGALIQKELANNEIILVDNLPLSLGIETAEGSFSPIISKNTPLPATRSKKYTIDTPGEKSVLVKVYQGERSIAAKNFLIGEFEFDKISKINQPVINIIFKVDINGLINVTIEDKHSGSNKDILIKNSIDIKEDVSDIIKICNQEEEEDNKELIKNQLYYKLEIRIEQILNNINNNNLIKVNNKKEITLDLLNNLDNLREKTIQELIKLDKKLDDDFFIPTESYSLEKDDEYDEMNIEDTIKKEKVEFLRSKIDFYFSKNITQFQRECLQKVINFLDNEKTYNNVDIDDKINYLKELFKENDKDELMQLCLFLKDEIENFNLNIDENGYKTLSEIIKKYLKMIDENLSFDYKLEIDNLNNICNKFFEK